MSTKFDIYVFIIFMFLLYLCFYYIYHKMCNPNL